MTTQEKLIAALFEKFAGESETAIARRCGLSIARFSNYKLGKREMDVDAVIGCAQALEWDVRRTVADHEIEIAPSPRVKALWRRLATASMAVVIGIGATQPAQAKSSINQHSTSGLEIHSLYIMRNGSWHAGGDGASPAALAVASAHFLLTQLIAAEEMPRLQQTYTPFAAETRPTFRGTPDKSPQR